MLVYVLVGVIIILGICLLKKKPCPPCEPCEECEPCDTCEPKDKE